MCSHDILFTISYLCKVDPAMPARSSTSTAAFDSASLVGMCGDCKYSGSVSNADSTFSISSSRHDGAFPGTLPSERTGNINVNVPRDPESKPSAFSFGTPLTRSCSCKQALWGPYRGRGGLLEQILNDHELENTYLAGTCY